MKKAIVLLFVFWEFTLCAQPQSYTVANAHSHNDYEQPAPFWTAYQEGFGSIEADIFLHHDSLLVAHDSSELSLHRSLELSYLKPLAACIKRNNGSVFPDKKKQLQLLIDIKTDSIATLNELIQTLRKFPALINTRSLEVVISGNRPEPTHFNAYPSFIRFDGVLSQEYSPAELNRVAMLSDNMADYVHGKTITDKEWQRLQAVVKKAHAAKKTVRFWGTPDNMDIWQTLMSLQVDYINTDHVNALGQFLRGDTIAVVGKPLPSWRQGYLDLHHINTGRGNAAYYIFPDSTTMLFDAGEEDPTELRTMSARNSAIRPNDSKLPFQWIYHYMKNVTPFADLHLDYAAISHFHEDHFGGWYATAPQSKHGHYVLSGITGISELIPIHHFLDRGYPRYDFPVPFEKLMNRANAKGSKYDKTVQNYLQWVKTTAESGTVIERFKAGTRNQIVLQHDAKSFPQFYVQQVKSNGDIWTGKDSATLQCFPSIDSANTKTWPDENSLSLVFTINYGPFRYYTGGDCAGNVFYGDAPWRDVETPVAKAIGEVDVATMDHHGNRDAVNEFQIKTFKPKAWIEQVWSSDHPGHEVLIRLTTPYLYKTQRDLFATNMLEANKLVIGPLIDNAYKSQQGHIVVRVLPGGNDYYIIILDDSTPDMAVKNIFGPYRSKPK
ncbi:phosphatidylinositol-specific phospholipase C/glycerophosphodiester phosphodiesterase family protein [Flavisolibacter nicotianae]|uniref:phosphatidylinositol-specific phospholipase C/glycerophosphodiester phosphodiesterase family protein n=1 Tax=Flavisolibacter nicotianae TaxID=2364882 RepID=UPI000EB509E4|nr:phosphatidylinositol-specific phospholipase C/glycerophosphodiester phosphodiesterase family protein [Flavisolibacter nicotianae]